MLRFCVYCANEGGVNPVAHIFNKKGGRVICPLFYFGNGQMLFNQPVPLFLFGSERSHDNRWFNLDIFIFEPGLFHKNWHLP